MSTRTVHKVIQVHPTEAQAIFNAFEKARMVLETNIDRLNKIYTNLDLEWEGNQKIIFQGEFGSTIECFNNIMLPQLRSWETKYRDFMVDKEIEIVEPY